MVIIQWMLVSWIIDLNRERKKAEQEKCKLAEALEKTKIEYKQALKNREVSLEIE